jgi:hypothetical protein
MQTSLNQEDYYFDENGLFVFTSKYHLRRGYCCGFECRECPFGYEGVAEPRRSQLISQQSSVDSQQSTADSLQSAIDSLQRTADSRKTSQD